MKKAKCYISTENNDQSIILCTRSIINNYFNLFEGVCVRSGNNTHIGEYSKKWNSLYYNKEIEIIIREQKLQITTTPAIGYEPLLGVVRVRWDDFMVHLKTDEFTLYFEVYPVQDWTHLPTGKEGMSYIDKENEPDTREEFETGKCLMKLEGSYCWRGVWEGRLYFPDQEYCHEDFEELSRLYNNCIVPWCRDFIQKRDGCELVK